MKIPLQLVITPQQMPHVARALAVHLRWCRENGVSVADGLVEVQEWAQVVARSLSSPLALHEDEGGRVEPLILTLDQAADLLGCSLSKVKTLIAVGKLPVVDFDGVRRVRRVDLEAFVERLAGGRSFRDGIEGKAPDPAASRRLVRRGTSDADAASTIRDQRSTA